MMKRVKCDLDFTNFFACLCSNVSSSKSHGPDWSVTAVFLGQYKIVLGDKIMLYIMISLKCFGYYIPSTYPVLADGQVDNHFLGTT